MNEPYRVFVVVDGDYGQRLAELAQTGPVWIVDTPANRTVAQQIWTAHPNRSHLEGGTTFKIAEGTSSEDILINELDTLDQETPQGFRAVRPLPTDDPPQS
jgi:hypothetical protein